MAYEQNLPGLREWTTVILGATVTFLFSYFFYGWAALQALFELDGVYREVCPAEEPLCSDRGSRMIFLYSVDNTVTILSGTIFGILVDRIGPVVLCILGAVLQSLSLLLMGWADGNPSNVMDPLLLAFVIGGVGGTALMIQSLKLAFIVAPARFALVMTVANCLVDSSSVVPLGLYRLYVAGVSRGAIFTGYAALCFALSMCLAYSWCGKPSARLHATNQQESDAAEAKRENLSTSRPRLHGLSVREQLCTVEFAFAVTMMMSMVFRSNAYLGVIKELLQDLGDAEVDNLYTQVLTLLLPASTLLIPLFDICMKRGGFAVTFLVVLFLGLIWNVVMLIPSLGVQVVGFAAFTNFRGLLFASFFTFIGHSFGNRTFGRINSILWFLTFLTSLLMVPCTELSKAWTGDMTAMHVVLLILCLPAVIMTLVLALHLRKYPAGDIIQSRQSRPEEAQKAKPEV
eukprot:s1191_g8.t1